jgi:uncharacterized protein (DUF983 family)
MKRTSTLTWLQVAEKCDQVAGHHHRHRGLMAAAAGLTMAAVIVLTIAIRIQAVQPAHTWEHFSSTVFSLLSAAASSTICAGD